ncbi:MAG: hypothetical protein LBM61_07785, partial [Prevotellaceae bacterium]|nr:hypothetical protein [Prevotellaceae bacterium]
QTPTAEQNILGKLEEMLAQMIVRYGERELYTEEDEEGNEYVVSVATYIQAELANDELELQVPLHKRILVEAVAHAREPEFQAHRYFISHSDAAFSHACTELASNRYQLSKYHERMSGLSNPEDIRKVKQAEISDTVGMLVINYKCAVLRDEMRKLLRSLQDPALSDPNQYLTIMTAWKEKHEVLQFIEKKEGDRVILPPNA